MSNLNYKQIIIDHFLKNVKNKKINIDDYNSKHCGRYGHWLEKQFDIKHNSRNEPDIYGYEMKKECKKITFGDFSASEYIFSKNRQMINYKNNWILPDENKISKIQFMKYFGQFNILKNRFSWSGSCIPKYNKWNNNGLILKISENNNIEIYYSYLKDSRFCKKDFPDFLQTQKEILIVFWDNEKMKNHINKKFNKNGFFMCKKNKNNNMYEKICFGKQFNFEYFINGIKNNKIIFDSGMYDGNSRNYSHFRADYNFWNDLIIEEY